MSVETSCAVCAMRAVGDVARAEHVEQIRQQRLLLAVMHGAADATAEVAAELGGCLDCTWRLASMSLLMFGTVYGQVLFNGDRDAASRAIEQGLLVDLDGQAGGLL
ncbi:hypothetical protein [Mycolicibacterium fortuitum]|uniref:hypothetical protein n=1 Tax=Mycolicibacterium fortuitum TaxID=1766 RepID=UPI00260DD47B|nr:hypothetical protein [Mycolicibacterium fortuitum]